MAASSITWIEERDVATIVRSRSVKDERGVLEVWTLNGNEFEVYHHIQIPSSPLCTAWLGTGSIVAVGSQDPSILIWDIDDINDTIEPFYVMDTSDGHTDSVLALAWNQECSASADKLVKIWDMVTGKCVTTLDHHLDKVQAVAWGDHAPYLLVSGSSDRTIVVKDMRAPLCTVSQFSVEANVESLICHPHSLVVGLENGMVEGYRAQPLFSIPAHDESVTTVSYNPCRRNILATGSLDGMVKLWDLSNNQPTCVASKNFGVGSIYSISFSEKDRFMLAIGGKTGKLQIWDTSKNP
ncbi:uncharacterized WD repeat-containing protein C17D11.16-like isoform X2 [Vicia villosa]|uniref:uncharacterized WD repeat-containing protein C17D11.16-like isoform X2 n=1 Tax=Vicia villosa TaxID=3911 RepID=UPI00273C9553|nr:uncharacterized WD repeat-containing protein C17D11.16-like isoform X2 [Vicia villosa]